MTNGWIRISRSFHDDEETILGTPSLCVRARRGRGRLAQTSQECEHSLSGGPKALVFLDVVHLPGLAAASGALSRAREHTGINAVGAVHVSAFHALSRRLLAKAISDLLTALGALVRLAHHSSPRRGDRPNARPHESLLASRRPAATGVRDSADSDSGQRRMNCAARHHGRDANRIEVARWASARKM